MAYDPSRFLDTEKIRKTWVDAGRSTEALPSVVLTGRTDPNGAGFKLRAPIRVRSMNRRTTAELPRELLTQLSGTLYSDRIRRELSVESASGDCGMCKRARKFPVVDGNGDQFTVYEVRERTGPFGLLTKRRWKLCTGEELRPQGRHAFSAIGSGHRLTRI
jgi:hypothetical protein